MITANLVVEETFINVQREGEKREQASPEGNRCVTVERRIKTRNKGEETGERSTSNPSLCP